MSFPRTATSRSTAMAKAAISAMRPRKWASRRSPARESRRSPPTDAARATHFGWATGPLESQDSGGFSLCGQNAKPLGLLNIHDGDGDIVPSAGVHCGREKRLHRGDRLQLWNDIRLDD